MNTQSDDGRILDVNELEYVGFWVRVGAALIDTVLVLLIIAPILTFLYGTDYWLSDRFGFLSAWNFLLNWIFPAIAVILFWFYRQATPGKMIVGARIVDAKTGLNPSRRQLIIRYLGYYLSTLALLVGLLWVAWDRRKQGWHDLLAGTVVVRDKRRTADPVKFNQ